jgi:hypothetical protein
MSKGKVAIIAVAAFVAVVALAISTGHGDMMGAGVMMVVMILGYVLPTIIAGSRNIPNAGAVAVINILLGWTCLGWIVALAMSVGGTPPTAPVAWPQPATKRCPDCAETVLAEARVCKHCGYRFARSAPDAQRELTPGKSTKVRCHNCQHVQMVPLGLSTFACEICNTKLRRLTR